MTHAARFLTETDGSALRLIYADAAERLGRVEVLDSQHLTTDSTDISALVASIPCFTPAARIATDRGEVAAGSLRPGMRVVTRDNGVQESAWIGRKTFGWRDLGLNPLLRPVRIRAGALGQGVPERDLTVSPNHRMLMGQGAQEVLIAARDLAGHEGVETIAPQGVEYIQILFTRHEAILADGAWSESFDAAPSVLAAMSASEQSAVETILPRRSDIPMQPVRPVALPANAEMSGR